MKPKSNPKAPAGKAKAIAPRDHLDRAVQKALAKQHRTYEARIAVLRSSHPAPPQPQQQPPPPQQLAPREQQGAPQQSFGGRPYNPQHCPLTVQCWTCGDMIPSGAVNWHRGSPACLARHDDNGGGPARPPPAAAAAPFAASPAPQPLRPRCVARSCGCREGWRGGRGVCAVAALQGV